jgi:hypothetical protein
MDESPFSRFIDANNLRYFPNRVHDTAAPNASLQQSQKPGSHTTAQDNSGQFSRKSFRERASHALTFSTPGYQGSFTTASR